MDHKSFEEKLLIDVTEKEARGEAALFANDHRGSFCNADAHAFLLPDVVVKA